MKHKNRGKPETVSVGNIVVRIYERQRPKATGKCRTVFEVADYTGGARRLRGFTDHGQARREAERIAAQLSTGETTAARMSNSEAASFGRAIELLRPTGLSLEMAAANVAKSFEILGEDAMVEAATFYARRRADQVERRKVADVVGELIAAKEARGKSARYIGDLRARLTRFAETFAVDISTITTADVQRWLDGLKLAPQTAKNFRTVLYSLFAFAEARGYVFKGGNPVEGTEHISTNGGSAIEIFMPVEITALLKHADKSFLPVVAIGAFAGLRSAEIERLEWTDVDLAGGFIHVSADQAKTRSRRLVPVQPNLAQWLAPYTRKRGKVWTGTSTDLRDARAACVKAAGVAWKSNGLRHSFASYRLAEIQNAAQVALEMGNSANVVFGHYRELVKPSAAAAWFAVAPQAPVNVVPLPKATTA
ncbi:MAG: tyrosine-type recombinase/integrase [Limisphaerales bacterium]